MRSHENSSPYIQYPLSSVLLYNGTTILHFALAGLGLYLSFNSSWIGTPLALVYLVFAFGQMYVWMPVRVCPNCPYYRMDNARCASALNLIARRFATPGKPQYFKRRAKGPFCHNNLYMTALLLPVPLLLVGLVVNFSPLLVGLLIAVILLVLFRVFVLFMRVACPNCQAKQRCPNAARMGIH